MRLRAKRKRDKSEYIGPIFAKPLQGYNILVSFSDNPEKLFVYDASRIINQVPPMAPLKDKAFFDSFFLDSGIITWNDDLDLSSSDLYKYSVPYEEWLLQEH